MLLFQNCTYSFHLLNIFNYSAKFIRLEHEKIYLKIAGSHLCNCFEKTGIERNHLFPIGQMKVTLLWQSIQLKFISLKQK